MVRRGGVPRYGAFSPDQLSNIHAREAALAEISCQNCGRLFIVGMDGRYAKKGRDLCDEIRLGHLHYGDPPNIRCCDVGPTEGSTMHRVLEYWFRDRETFRSWQRDPAFEGQWTEVYEEADIVGEVLAAVNSGEKAIRVACTSIANRYYLAGRIAAATTINGSVLVTFPAHLSLMAREMLRGLVPEDAIGTGKQARSITLANFESLPEVSWDTLNTIVVLAGCPPSEKALPKVKEAAEQLWHRTTSWLEGAAAGSVLVEFSLAGRRQLIERPGVVIDGRQTRMQIA
jgi:hypothetical protein